MLQVLAYLMKEYNMSRQEAFDFVKDKRSCIMPNKAFWHQLETYEGILSARYSLIIENILD
jgi:protein phosphatase slingshot